MKKIQRTIARFRNVLFASAAVLLLAQCSEEEELLTPNIPVEEEITATGELQTNVSSLSITSENTVVAEAAVDCKTCTYVVAKEATTINGEELNLKPGSIICLDQALRYGDLEFVNFQGDDENPIIIAHTNFPSSK